MNEQKPVNRFVQDLGIAAYLLMHGYKVVGKKLKAIYFECNNNEEACEFDKYVLEYQPPNEFYTFDSCLMYLKKIGDLQNEIGDENYRTVSDLGIAAYLLLHEYKNLDKKDRLKIIGKKDRLIYFSVPEHRVKEFEQLCFEYLPSPFHTYDSCLMSLKKLPSS